MIEGPSEVRYRTSQIYHRSDPGGAVLSRALGDCLRHVAALRRRGLSVVIDRAELRRLAQAYAVVSDLETTLCRQLDSHRRRSNGGAKRRRADRHPALAPAEVDVLTRQVTRRNELLDELVGVFALMGTAYDQLQTAEAAVPLGRFRPSQVYRVANDNFSGRVYDNAYHLMQTLHTVTDHARRDLQVPRTH